MNIDLNKFKWISTILVLSGILFTNLNIYPINILLHGIGVLCWTVCGFFIKDKAIIKTILTIVRTIVMTIIKTIVKKVLAVR